MCKSEFKVDEKGIGTAFVCWLAGRTDAADGSESFSLGFSGKLWFVADHRLVRLLYSGLGAVCQPEMRSSARNGGHGQCLSPEEISLCSLCHRYGTGNCPLSAVRMDRHADSKITGFVTLKLLVFHGTSTET